MAKLRELAYEERGTESAPEIRECSLVKPRPTLDDHKVFPISPTFFS
jgi:hypothetical protein